MEHFRQILILCTIFLHFVCCHGYVEPATHTNRIVGGHVADIVSYPYQVSVQELNNHICGGSILTSRWILTAGHCIDDTIARYINVRVGSSFYNHSGTVHNVRSAIAHPEHVPYSWIVDYALLELEEGIVFSSVAQPIVLASRSEDLEFAFDCVVTGWGRTLNSAESFEQLRAVEIPLVPRALCEVAYEGKIDDSMVCAGDYENGGRGSCTYDSGGALVCGGLQVGIVSWGKGCALPGYPDVYSSVLYARKWIDSIVSGALPREP
uniref:trypsin n=1 Tax=Anopheles farauti TaxID=69004 RepID=A0A182Q8Z1_9DIPT